MGQLQAFGLALSLGFRLVRHKAHHPLRHGHAVVVALQAGHAVAVDLFTQGCLKYFQQLTGIVVNKLRMALEAQHLIVDVVSRERAEITGGDNRGVLR